MMEVWDKEVESLYSSVKRTVLNGAARRAYERQHGEGSWCNMQVDDQSGWRHKNKHAAEETQVPEVQSEDMSWEQEWCREQHEGDVWQDGITRWTKHAATPAEARLYRIWEQTGLGMDQTVTRMGRQSNEVQDRSMLTANTRMEIHMYHVSPAGQ